MITKEKLKDLVGRSVRYQRNINQQTLFDVSTKANISVSYLSDIERGRTLPSLYTVLMLAEALGVNYPELLGITIINDPPM